LIAAPILALLTLAAVAGPFVRRFPRWAPLALASAPLGFGVWYGTLVSEPAKGPDSVSSWEWVPELGLDLSFRIDGLSLSFAVLICLIGAVVLIYTSSYFRHDPRLGSLLSRLLAFMTAMLGLVLADNLLLLFVFWELTSITSFLLIGFDSERESAKRAALQALLVTALGGLALLAGLVLLGLAGGTFQISSLGSGLPGHPWYEATVILVLIGAFTKSAIFPFHFWLPNAMEAPSPVSALLHSATMVKAGVYLIARLHPSLGGTLLWDETLAIFGGFTMLGAAFLATRQTQFKPILAYSTVSSLGTLVMLIGLGAAKAASTYLIAHAMFKGALFLVAGILAKMTGESEPERLGGLLRRTPLTAIAAVLAGLSMAGMFPLVGFVGKELLLKAGLAHPEWALLATVATVIAGSFTVMAAALVTVQPFFGEGVAAERVGDPEWRQLVGPIVLACGGLLAGLFPWWFVEPLVGAMKASISGEPGLVARLRPLELLWPPSSATVLSLLALVLGGLLYWQRLRYRSIGPGLVSLATGGPSRGYDCVLRTLNSAARVHTSILQNGSLQAYVRTTVVVVVGFCVAALVRAADVSMIAEMLVDTTSLDVALFAGLVALSLATVVQRTALASIAALGGIGFLIALVFGLYGAPDLAMTQFAVETLLVIIFVLVLFHVPAYRSISGRGSRALDVCLAGAAGVMLTVFVLAVLSQPAPERISSFFAERSVPEGFGRNVVNVILVDFRALDTLGEIFVIGAAAMGVHALLRLHQPRKNGADEGTSR